MTETNISEILRQNGVYIGTTWGSSMSPLLRDRRDTVVISKNTARLKKYDIALYMRDGKYILHRVVKVLPSSYIIRGDNCILGEEAEECSILGILTEIWRGERRMSTSGTRFKLMSRLITFFHPIIALKLLIKAKLRKGGR